MSLLSISRPVGSVRQWGQAMGLSQVAADRIHGSLSSPGKMPCKSYGIPAAACIVGSKLRASSTKAKPTVCGSCYALKNQYLWDNVKACQQRRLASVRRACTDTSFAAQWIRAMVTSIGWTSRDSGVFRWHDSGDLQSMRHLSLIVDIADLLPWIRFWIPTRERQIVRQWIDANGPLPANITVRESLAMVGHFPRAIEPGRTISAVARKGQDLPKGSHACPARHQGGFCNDCRACWTPTVPLVIYPLH